PAIINIQPARAISFIGDGFRASRRAVAKSGVPQAAKRRGRRNVAAAIVASAGRSRASRPAETTAARTGKTAAANASSQTLQTVLASGHGTPEARAVTKPAEVIAAAAISSPPMVFSFFSAIAPARSAPRAA